MRRAVNRLMCALAGVIAITVPRLALAQTMHYRLGPGSEIVDVCDDCPTGQRPAEVLRGVFDLTVLPMAGHTIEAITGVEWSSASYGVRGSGFVQRIGDGELAIVIDARINGSSTLLTSGRRQRSASGTLRLVLVTPRDAPRRSMITLVAEPVAPDGPDRDGDGTPDTMDNCAALRNADQLDEDRDGVGDACDTCHGTPAGGLVRNDGCALTQLCPCDGPTEDETWNSHRAYVQCVAGALKRLRRQGKITRHEIVELVQTAVRSTCGRRELALR